MQRIVISVAVLAFSVSTVLAQESYPTKPVRFIAPYPPGGSSEVLARVMAIRYYIAQLICQV